ncbi:MAG: DUF983 domain-containing protein [Nitratireductor sp.]
MNARKFGGAAATKASDRPLGQAMKRGFLGRCPQCGEGRMFARFLRTAERCDACGEEFHHHRADDLPAYLVVVVVGHVIVGAFMGVEATSTLSTWQHLAIWVPITIISALALLQPTKGAVVGLQWALRMHGFGGPAEELETHPEL